MKLENIALHIKREGMLVQIRYNTQYDGNSGYKWRLLVDGKPALLIDKAHFYCPSFTTEDVVDVDDKKVKKFHISSQANELMVVIEPETEFLIAHIK